jgi:hypothetical protein
MSTTLYYNLNKVVKSENRLKGTLASQFYSGVSMTKLTESMDIDSAYILDSKISFVGYRQPAQLPFVFPQFQETVTIYSAKDMICATSIYMDKGTGSNSSAPTSTFVVLTATGRFVGTRELEFTYNSNGTRSIELIKAV